MSCIDVSHLSKLYGSVHAVSDLTLSVKSGQVFGFLGPKNRCCITTTKL
jgi:ABC-2 type transport system ATP-binding protein